MRAQFVWALCALVRAVMSVSAATTTLGKELVKTTTPLTTARAALRATDAVDSGWNYTPTFSELN